MYWVGYLEKDVGWIGQNSRVGMSWSAGGSYGRVQPTPLLPSLHPYLILSLCSLLLRMSHDHQYPFPEQLRQGTAGCLSVPLYQFHQIAQRFIMGRSGHHHHYGGAARRRGRGGFEDMTDFVAENKIPPSLVSGAYTFSGNQMAAITHLDNINLIIYPAPIPGLPQPPPNFIQEAKLNVAGTKASTTSFCCMMMTFMLGSFFIFPLFFMCCSWWKSIVFPKYEVSLEFYKAVGRFLRTCTTCVSLSVVVVDSAFDQAKARALYQSLEGTQLKNFTFQNRAVACNYANSEADDFQENMRPMKSLPITSSITWGDMKM